MFLLSYARSDFLFYTFNFCVLYVPNFPNVLKCAGPNWLLMSMDSWKWPKRTSCAAICSSPSQDIFEDHLSVAYSYHYIVSLTLMSDHNTAIQSNQETSNLTRRQAMWLWQVLLSKYAQLQNDT